MWESVPFHFKSGPISKSFPIPFRCVAVSYCHFHLSSELTELTALTIHPTAFWLLGWNALSSNSQSESAVTIALLLLSSRSQHWAADAVAYSTAAPWNTVFFFCTPALFCVFTLFFAWPITFLHFYQRTSISEIWLHLLLLPRQHCVSSLKQRARTAAAAAAAGVGGEVTDNTLAPALHTFVSIKTHFYPSDSPNSKNIKPVALWVPIWMFILHM